MAKQFWLERLARYYRSKGLASTVKQIGQKIKDSVCRKPYYLYAVDLADRADCENELSSSIEVVAYQKEADVPSEIVQPFFERLGEKAMRHYMNVRFGKGAWLWVVCMDRQAAGYLWSIRGGTVEPHYFPLTANDVNLFDDMILEPYRGRGLNAMLINLVLSELKKQSVVRVFIDTQTTNRAEIRSLAKTDFKVFVCARKHRWGRHIMTLWRPYSGEISD